MSLGQSFGLSFYSHDKLKEERTELNLTPEKSLYFNDPFKLSFDLNIRAYLDQGYGYVVRIIQNDTTNIDIVYKINYTDNKWNFYLVLGQETAVGSYHINQELQLNEWIKFEIEFNPELEIVNLYCAGKKISAISNKMGSKYSYKIFFGACDYAHFRTRDVPAMSIRDVKISSDQTLQHHWPLNADSGTTTIDIIDHKKATVRNPNWLKPKHENWSEVLNDEFPGHVQVAADQNSEILYIIGSDQLIIYSISEDSYQIIQCENSPAQLIGGKAFYNPLDRGLYSYDVDNRTINKFDFINMQWDENKIDQKPHTIFLHHNSQFSTYDTSLYIIAGYGQHEYKNSIQKVSTKDNKWEIVEKDKDLFNPRYLSASGYSSDTIYILGGYGSPSGSQMLNPQTYNHLLAFSVKNQRFSREMHVNLPKQDICFSNSMVIIEKSRGYYALAFQLFADESFLQLVHGYLDNPQLNLMANPIPYHFQDTKSFADLFYFPKSNKLVAYTSFLEEDEISTVQLYSLLFPPNVGVAMEGEEGETTSSDNLLSVVLLTLTLGTLFLFLIWYYKKRKTSTNPPASNPIPSDSIQKTEEIKEEAPIDIAKQPITSSILFFGGFQVYDGKGADITGKFTPLLKELFLLIWIHTLKDNKGISSEKLTEILWFDKSSESARNNKAVNIAKLRTILTEIGDCEITHKTGYWKIFCNDPKVYNDYSEFLKITQSKTNLTKKNVLQLIKIAEKGAILLNMNYLWLDEFKASLSEKLIETLYFYAKKLEIQEDPNLVVQIADCIFSCDSINEEAMVLKCKAQHIMGSHSLAKSTYSKFCKYYTELYDQEYKTSFSDVINRPLEEIVSY
jgi:two-component SAPR family response regulator